MSDELEFSMNLGIDLKKFEGEWDKKLADIQRIIDGHAFHIKLDINEKAIADAKKTLDELKKTAAEIGKTSTPNTGIDKSTIAAMEASIKEFQKLTVQSPFDTPQNKEAVNSMLQQLRTFKDELKGIKAAPLDLNKILSMGGADATGSQLKIMRQELQSFIDAEVEGSEKAVKANEELKKVKERITNMYGKQESALKSSDEEKKIQSTITAYKKLEAEQARIVAQIRERISLEQGKVVSVSGVNVSASGTQAEIMAYNELATAMAGYRKSLSELDQQKLTASKADQAQSQITNLRQEFDIQQKINTAIKNKVTEIEKQTAAWAKYATILEKPENTINQIQTKLRQIDAIRAKLNMDSSQAATADNVVSGLRSKMAGLSPAANALKNQLAQLEAQWSRLSLAEMKGEKGQALIAKFKALSTEADKYSGSLRQTVSTLDKATLGIDKNTSAFGRQRGILNGMPQMLNSYISILGGMRLFANIRDITGEYELQRVALGAIIQDAERANALFEQIKVKAVESPFMVKDLVSYTKQLAAFRVETEDLFGSMNMLADISAGLGVDMSRLILAFGQVRAASVLRGQELRQFTEAGIPLVELLAEKFTKLNGEATSTGEVFKLISERAVPFEMIKEIFQDMTSEGGTFFNMQEIQAKTLKGQYNNLTDAIQIMFDEIGRSNRGALSGIASLARDVVNNWRIAAVGISSVASIIIGYNAVMIVAGMRTAYLEKTTLLLARSQALAARSAQLQATNNTWLAGTTMAASRAAATAAAANSTLVRSFYALKAAMLANPVTAIIAGLFTLAGVLASVISYQSKATVKQKELNENLSRMSSSANTSTSALNSLLLKLKNAEQGTQEYADTIKEINSRAGNFLETQLSEAQGYNEIEMAVRGVTAAIMEKAKADAYAAGITTIQEAYTGKSSKQYDRAISALTSKSATIKMSDADARVFIESIRSTVSKNPELYNTGEQISKLLVSSMTDYAKKTGQFKDYLDIEGFFGGLGVFSNVDKWATGIIDNMKEIEDEEAKLAARTNTMFPTDNVESYAKKIEDIKDKYKALNTELKGSPEERAGMLLKSKQQEMEELISVYESFGQKGLAEKTRKDLAQLLKIGEDWETVVSKFTGEGPSAIFRVMEGETYFDYVKRLRDEYDDLIKKQQEFKGKESLVPKSEMDLITTRIESAKKIAEGLRMDLVASGTNPRIKALSEEVKYIETAYKKYQELIKIKTPESARKEIQSLPGGAEYTLAFSDQEMTATYDRVIKEFGSLGKSASDEMSNAIIRRNELNTDLTIESFKKQINKIGLEISRVTEARDFYDKILGLTGDQDLAEKLVGNDLAGKNMKTMLEDQLKATFSSLEIDIPATMDLDTIQSVIDSLGANPERQEKAQQSFKKLKDYINETTAATLELENKLSDLDNKNISLSGTGVSFDISKIIKEQAIKITEINKQQRVSEAELLKLKDVNGQEWYDKELIRIKSIYDTQRQSEEKIGQEKIKRLDFDQFKESDDWAKTFEDLDRISTDTINRILENLEKLKNSVGKDLPVDDYKSLISAIEKLREESTQRDPFASLSASMKKYGDATDKVRIAQKKLNILQQSGTASSDSLKSATKELTDAQDEQMAALSSSDEALVKIKKLGEEFGSIGEKIGGTVGEVMSGVSDISSATVGMISSIVALAKAASAGMFSAAASASTAIKTIEAASVILAVISAAIQLATIVANLIGGKSKAELDTERLREVSESISDINKIINKQLEKRVELIEEATAAEAEYLDTISQEDIEKQKKYIIDQLESLRGVYYPIYGYMGSTEIFGKKGKNNDLSLDELMNLMGLGNMEEFIEWWNDGMGVRELLAKGYTITNEESWQSIIDAYNELTDAALEAEEAKNKAATGTSFDSLKDSLDDLITDMDTAFSDVADSFEDHMTKAILNLVKSSYLTDALEKWYNQFVEATTSGDELTSAEVAALEELYNTIYKKAQDLYDTAVSAAGIKPGSSDLTGISKSIAGISEDTAKVLGGYANQLLFYSVGQYNTQVSILNKLNESQPNTLNDLYNIQAVSMNHLAGIKSDTGRLIDLMDKLVIAGGKTMNVRLVGK